MPRVMETEEEVLPAPRPKKRLSPGDSRLPRESSTPTRGETIGPEDKSVGGLSSEALLEMQRKFGNRFVSNLIETSGGGGSGGGGGTTHDTTTESSGHAPAEKKEEKPGFFSRVGSAFASAGKAVWSGMKAVGRGIATAASFVWKGLKWLGSQVLAKFEAIFLRVGRWIEKLPARVGRLLAGLWEGVKSFKPWTLAWWESLGKADTWLKFLKWVGARAVDLLEIFGLGEIYETLMDFAKFNTRPLTANEKALASTVFGSSINLELVRVDEAAVIGPAFSHREYTSFHTINGWGGISKDTLIHELTHVWQYENAGAIYMPQAIHAQVWGEGYVYGGVARLTAEKAAGKGLLSFNREQQAQIVEDFYRIKAGIPQQGDMGTTADLPLYAYFVKTVSTLTEAQLLAT